MDFECSSVLGPPASSQIPKTKGGLGFCNVARGCEWLYVSIRQPRPGFTLPLALHSRNQNTGVGCSGQRVPASVSLLLVTSAVIVGKTNNSQSHIKCSKTEAFSLILSTSPASRAALLMPPAELVDRVSPLSSVSTEQRSDVGLCTQASADTHSCRLARRKTTGLIFFSSLRGLSFPQAVFLVSN